MIKIPQIQQLAFSPFDSAQGDSPIDKKKKQGTKDFITFGKRTNFMRGFWTIVLLVLSNTFMTFAWYGHLKFREMKWFENLGLIAVVLISWGIALFEYFFQVPANRLGYKENGGPFSLVELKVVQEVITLVVFVGFTLIFFKNETFFIDMDTPNQLT